MQEFYFHSKSKHIDVRYHWIRDVLEEKQMHIEKVHTDENVRECLYMDVLPREMYVYRMCKIVARCKLVHLREKVNF